MGTAGRNWDTLQDCLELMDAAPSWSELLGAFHEAVATMVDFDVCSCLLLSEKLDGGGSLVGYLGSADDAWLESYGRYYCRRIPPEFLLAHQPALLGTVHAARDYGQTEFTREFLGARNISAFTALCLPVRQRSSYLTVNFNFTLYLAEQHFRELTMLEHLRGHAQRLFLLHDRIEQLEKVRFRADHGLTPREEEVAELAIQHLTSSQIAQRLGVSSRTVETHLFHLYEKVGVLNRKQLIQALIRPIL